MARQYRKVESAVSRLRRASGIIAAATGGDATHPMVALGMLDVIIEHALWDLQADSVVEPSTAFVDGYDALVAAQPVLPFGDA